MTNGLRALGALLLLLWVASGARRAPWRVSTMTLGCTGGDDFEDLRRALRCEGKTDDLHRKICFHEALRAVARRRTGVARERALDVAEHILAAWPSHQREIHAGSFDPHATSRPLPFDVLRLVRRVVEWYPDDTAQNTSAPSRAIWGSTHAAGLESYEMVRASPRFDALRRGPGASRLRRLRLYDCSLGADTWRALLEWPGRATLEDLSVGSIWKTVESDAFWAFITGATSLRALAIHDSGDEAVRRLGAMPALSHRLRVLDLTGTLLCTSDADVLIDNAALDGLETLDLRRTGLRTEDVDRVRRAPQFAHTTVLAAPPTRP